MTPEEQLQFDSLKQRIAALENKQVSLPYPLSYNDQEILRKWLKQDLSSVLFETMWNDYFYFSTIFESGDGYDSSGTGTATVNPDGLALNSGSSNNDSVTFNKTPSPAGVGIETLNILSFKQPQRFRANFAIDSTSNVTAYITRGVNFGPTYPYYGFKIVNSTLKAVSRDNNTAGETTVDIGTISTNTVYVVEARLLPGEKVVYYLLNNSTNQLEEKAVINTNIPLLSNTNNRAFFEYFISTQDANNKLLTSSFFEYIQKRETY